MMMRMVNQMNKYKRDEVRNKAFMITYLHEEVIDMIGDNSNFENTMSDMDHKFDIATDDHTTDPKKYPKPNHYTFFKSVDRKSVV